MAPLFDESNSPLVLFGVGVKLRRLFLQRGSLIMQDFSVFPDEILRLAKDLKFDPESKIVTLILDKVDLIDDHRLKLISFGTFAYSALALTEGIGLMLEKVWAEYLTLILTISFLPWELYELSRHANWFRLSLLLINLVVLWYLVWLLKQKQTQDWKTTKATADAVYALLLRGSNVLASDELVEVSLAGQEIKPEKVEAGTGFYEEKFSRGEIKPDMGNITLKKVDQGVAWGSVHWQYLEDMSKVTAYDGTPLKLTKELYTKQLTEKGPVLVPVNLQARADVLHRRCADRGQV